MTNPKKRISRAFKNKREKKKKIESERKNANFDSCFRMFMQRFWKNHRNVSCSVNAWMWVRARWKEIGKENGKGSFFTSAFSYVNSFKDYVEIAHTIFFCLTSVPYTLCSLLLLLPFDAVIVRVFLITLFLVLSVSYSHYLFWSCFLLLFVFSLLSLAHKSYRVSVTVATVKRTNSVQEYLTTVFITIQFSLSLLVIVRSVCWLCVSQCSTFSTLPLSLSASILSSALSHTYSNSLFYSFQFFVVVALAPPLWAIIFHAKDCLSAFYYALFA